MPSFLPIYRQASQHITVGYDMNSVKSVIPFFGFDIEYSYGGAFMAIEEADATQTQT